MKGLLSRYLLRAHIAPFFFGTGVVLFILLLQFLINSIDKLLGKGLDPWVILELIGLNMAWMTVLAIPMGVLVSTLMAFGNLSGTNEITIMKSGGMALMQMMRSIIIFGALLFGGLFWFNDAILPDANHRVKTLMRDIQRKKPTFAVEKGQFATEIDGYSILARNIDTTTSLLQGVTIYDNTTYQQVNVISADSASIIFTRDFSKLVVHLFQGEIHQLNQQDRSKYRKVTFDEHLLTMKASGFLFSETESGVLPRGDREMNIDTMEVIVARADSIRNRAIVKWDSALVRHLNFTLSGSISTDSTEVIRPTTEKLPTAQHGVTKRVQKHTRTKTAKATDESAKETAVQEEASAQDILHRVANRLAMLTSSVRGQASEEKSQRLRINKYLVEIHKKYAIPAACFFFVFVGCPLGIITRRGNFGVSASISLGFYVLYWGCLISGERLADRGLLEPWLGMWMANIIIGSMGFLLTLYVSRGGLHLPAFLTKKP
jgi:lipopolysaccharide export system permease protein